MAHAIQKQITNLVDNRVKSVFLFDFDGTLVDLAPHPDKIHIPPDLVRNLKALATCAESLFAIVSGRTIAQIDRFLPNVKPTALGSHGAEYRLRNNEISPLAPQIPVALRNALRAVSDGHACFFEDKKYSVSIHLPSARAHDNLGAEIVAALGETARTCHVRKAGRTYEILQESVNKGSGILHLMRQDGFSDRVPVYIGDDTETDESLNVLSEIGGVLIPIRSSPWGSRSEDHSEWKTEDARSLVEALSHQA